MWCDENGGLALTRSNKAVTRFEPLQHLHPHPFSIYRVFGDGRLGPLDLFVDMIHQRQGSLTPPSVFYRRVLPELSANISVKNVKNKAGKLIAHKLTVTVNDAGDAVAGATAAAEGHHNKTNTPGVATLKLPGSSTGQITVTITDPGYQTLPKRINL
jgi:hypothetical protein